VGSRMKDGTQYVIGTWRKKRATRDGKKQYQQRRCNRGAPTVWGKYPAWWQRPAIRPRRYGL
jgi:hypothetical protein